MVHVAIESVDCVRDLGVIIDTKDLHYLATLVDTNLKLHSHTSRCVPRVNHVLSVITKSFH